MKISRIEHLGIAVKSIDEVLPYFEAWTKMLQDRGSC